MMMMMGWKEMRRSRLMWEWRRARQRYVQIFRLRRWGLEWKGDPRIKGAWRILSGVHRCIRSQMMEKPAYTHERSHDTAGGVLSE